MKNKLLYTFEQDLRERLKNPKFRKAWEKSEVEYLLAKQLIEARLTRKLSQRALAAKLHTSQAVISRLETMQGNPSLSFLKRLTQVLGNKLILQIK